MANAKKTTGSKAQETERPISAAEQTAKDVAARKLAGLAVMENYREKLKQEKANRMTDARRQREADRLAQAEAEKEMRRQEMERKIEEERATVAARNAEADEVLERTATPEPAVEETVEVKVAEPAPEVQPEPTPSIADSFKADEDEEEDASEPDYTAEEDDEDDEEDADLSEEEEAAICAYQFAAAQWMAERDLLRQRSERAEIDRLEDRIRAAEERRLRHRLEEREAALIARIEALENAPAPEPIIIRDDRIPDEVTEALRDIADRPAYVPPVETEPEIRIDTEVPDERTVAEADLLRARVIPEDVPEDDWIEIDCPPENFAVPGIAPEFASKDEARDFFDEKRAKLRELSKDKKAHKKGVRKTFLFERTDHWFGVICAQRNIVETLAAMLDVASHGPVKKDRAELKSSLSDAISDYNKLAKKCAVATKVALTPISKHIPASIIHGRDYDTPRLICRRSQIDTVLASCEPSAQTPASDAEVATNPTSPETV